MQASMKRLTQEQIDCVLAFGHGRIHPFLVRRSEMTVEGLGHRLAGFYRFGGDTRITVAQHCTDGARFLRKAGASILTQFAFHIHDGGEAISGLGDIPAPILACLPPEAGDVNRYAQEAVYRYCLGVTELDARTRAEIHAMDLQMRAMEARYWYHNWHELFPDLLEVAPPAGWKGWRGPISPEMAEREWIEQYHRLESEWEAER